MKLLFENLPASLERYRESLGQCLEAMDRVTPLRSVDPDWPDLRAKIGQVNGLLAAVKARLPDPHRPA